MGVPVMTLRMAARRGIRDIWHLNKGVGDALMFAGIAREYHKKTGMRPLLFVPQHNIFRYCDFCWFLFDRRFQNVPDTSNTFEVFYKFYQEQKHGRPIKLRGGYEFNLRPLEYLKNVYVVGNQFQKFYGGFPKRGQILQWVGNRMGLTGEIDVKPELRLIEYEKEFGKFARGKIVIKCGGNGPYKYLIGKIAQGIVDGLKHKFDFLQIGDFDDPILEGAENLFRLNMREFAGVLHNARMFVGAIGGMMHLARAVDCPAVILHGCEHDEFYYPSQRKVFSENRCMLCAQNCWWPDKDDEHRCINKYRCIIDFDIKKIIAAISEELEKPREAAAMPDIFKCVGKLADINSADSWWLTFDDFILNFQVPQPHDSRLIHAHYDTLFINIFPRQEYKIKHLTGLDYQEFDVFYYFSKIADIEIYPDNPLIIRLMPKPSFFANIGKIAALQTEWTAEWHKEEPVDDSDYWLRESCPKPEFATLRGFARANHMMNFMLWRVEDESRRKDVPPEYIADAKHRIDRFNQLRNDFAEKIDETLSLMLAGESVGAGKAPLNTESLGMAIDRLSIMAIKIYHMQECAKNRKVRAECLSKTQKLIGQRRDLLESIKVLIAEYIHGSKRHQSYYQMKMYNNPALRGKFTPS